MKRLQEKIREEAREGWEYARYWGSKFHSKQRKIDLVRRRLWLRKMVTSNPDAEPIFTFREDVDDSDLDQAGQQKAGQIPAFYSPRMYITYRGENVNPVLSISCSTEVPKNNITSFVECR